jgi:hypothetical protein
MFKPLFIKKIVLHEVFSLDGGQYFSTYDEEIYGHELDKY